MQRAKTKASRLESLFYRGRYQDIVEKTLDRPTAQFDAIDVPFLVSALSYLGRVEEAEVLFSQHLAELSPEGEALARLCLATVLCRHSHYDRALVHLCRNLRTARRSHSPRLRMCAFQGAAFYRYFCGRYARALKFSERAFHEAVLGQDLYGKFLTSDTKGHTLMQTGEVSSGMRCLREAIRFSKCLNQGQSQEAARISLAIYQATFGLSPKTDIETLHELFRKHAPPDTYSRASLLLEIARQLTLRGKLRASQKVLNEACPLIFSNANRRQGVWLNLRYAQNHFLAGEYAPALNLVRASARELDPRVDKALLMQVLGMETKLKRALGLGADEDPSHALVSYTGSGLARRMLARESGTPGALRAVGEDPLGDLVDSAQKGELGPLLASGYLSLLYRRLPVQPGESVLFLDLDPESLLIVDRGDWEYVPRGISPTLKRMLRRLSLGECTKEILIREIWGYTYDRLRHDPLIYQAISRLRHLLGEQSRWIEVRENGAYRLHPAVQLRYYQEALPAAVVEAPAASGDPLAAQLNHRQLAFLRRTDNAAFLDVKGYKDLFQVSQVTASRDLAQLHQMALVKRVGRGRSTRYYRQEIST